MPKKKELVMKIGTTVIHLGESVLLAVVSYKVVGFMGPVVVAGLYIVGTIINNATKGMIATH